MARATGPLFSLDASGSIGGAITFAKWKGRNYVRRRVIPTNPKSGGQVGRRAMMKFLAEVWSSVSVADKATWTTIAAQIIASNFNAYVQANMKYWHNYMSPSQAAARLATGTPSDNALTAAVWEENRIKLSFAGSALGDAWGKVIFGDLGATVTNSVGTAILVVIDFSIGAHDVYWTPHRGDPAAEWTFDSRCFSDDGVLAVAGGPETTP